MHLQHQLSPHFNLHELTISREAVVHGWDNDPRDDVVLSNLVILAQLLEGVRGALGGYPIVVTSGYRSQRVNAAVGGAAASAHMAGLAADCIVPGFGTPLHVCTRLVMLARAGTLLFAWDQLIYEGGWVHIAAPVSGIEPRGQVLTAKFNGPGKRRTYLQGIQAVA